MTNSADYGEARSLTPSVLTRPNRKTFIIRHVTLLLYHLTDTSCSHRVYTALFPYPSPDHNYTCFYYQCDNNHHFSQMEIVLYRSDQKNSQIN